MTNVIKCSKCGESDTSMIAKNGEYLCYRHAPKALKAMIEESNRQRILYLDQQIAMLIEQRNVLAKAVDDVVTVFSLSYIDSPYTRTQALEIIELARRIVKEINLQETEA